MHTSVRLETPCEFINVTPINPLISKCQIKVCYVSDKPNRNKSVITKEVARQMANSLPGSPIVGYFNEAEGDFEEHNRIIDISNGKFRIKDGTRPYGFVDLGAKVWFQKFLDDGVNEREYMMTEGYLWTGQYPEAQRIIEQGNNQSMELDEKTLNANWAKDENGKPKFFIINEAVISKLCILGEEYEPCFEGSNITKVQFSFDDGFKEQLFKMITEVKDLLEGGTKVSMNEEVKTEFSSEEVVEETVETVVEETVEEVAEEAVVESVEEVVEETTETAAEEVEFKKNEEEDKKDEDSEDKTEKLDNDEIDNTTEDKESSEDEKKKKDEDEEFACGDKKKYSLEEIPEYIELQAKFAELESKYNEIVSENEKLNSQVSSLTEFKKVTERAEKENMIKNTFYMLSDEDKAEVLENVDAYSLSEIEAKLSILCVRNRVSFAALEEEENSQSVATTYNLGSDVLKDESTPAWVKAVLDTAKTLN